MIHEVRVTAPTEGDLRRLGACHYEVYVDGRQVRPSRVQLVLDMANGGVPELTLDFPHVRVSAFEGTARVVLAPGLEDELIGLGWTPPEAAPEDDAHDARSWPVRARDTMRRRVDFDTTDDLGREMIHHADDCSSRVRITGNCDCLGDGDDDGGSSRD